ncbi:redoxin domain-containing protein [Hymenobacter gummosus]|uniref:Redoxin domain-containing protein n=1 Tax=Hymenobacter gummosus TaxID=1776032 RepID=A0A431U9D5_9BACT|nr:TlpA disulfide reductase family protein [Hymenobacter gummosus]RTQ53707.1 redoxin domain-containing protein [Hymenobacter gummosus]
MPHLFASRRAALLLPAALLAGLLTAACSSAPGTRSAAARPAVIRGHVDHPQSPAVTLVHYRDLITYQYDSLRLPLTADGGFQLRLDTLTRPIELLLAHNQRQLTLFVEPGDSLHLRFDGAEPEQTLRFTGRGAGINTYLAELDRRGMASGLLGTPAGQRIGHADTLRRRATAFRWQQQRLLDSVAARLPLSPAARQFARFGIDYEWGNVQLDYPGFYRYAAKKELPGVDTAYYAFIRQLRLPNDSALHVDGYRSYLSSYLMYRQGGGRANEPANTAAQRRWDQRYLAVLDQTLGRSRSRDEAVAHWLAEAMDFRQPGLVAPLVESFRHSSRDTSLSGLISRRFAQKLKLAPGQSAPAFALADTSGRTVALSSFRGRVVYLDFWATWCGPCLQEMKAAPPLYRAYAGRPDVAFVAVSLDHDAPAWRRWVRRNAHPGVTYLHAPGMETPVAKDYQINGIPSYWLIGPDGRIVDNAPPRPSQLPALQQVIDKARQLGGPTVVRR